MTQNDTRIHIGICDDEKQCRKQIKDILMEITDEKRVVIWEFSSGRELLDACRGNVYLSIVYLDIYLGDENGVDIAGQLKKISEYTKVVFVTGTEDYAIKAFEIRALHYLIKPVTKEHMLETLRRWKLVREEVKRIYLKIDREYVSLPLNDIAYLKSDNHKIQIILKGGKCVSTYMTLKDLEEHLTEDFLKIKRGLIVNMDFIDVISSTFCILKNGMDLEISRMNRSEVKKQYEAYVMRVLKKRQTEGSVK